MRAATQPTSNFPTALSSAADGEDPEDAHRRFPRPTLLGKTKGSSSSLFSRAITSLISIEGSDGMTAEQVGRVPCGWVGQVGGGCVGGLLLFQWQPVEVGSCCLDKHFLRAATASQRSKWAAAVRACAVQGTRWRGHSQLSVLCHICVLFTDHRYCMVSPPAPQAAQREAELAARAAACVEACHVDEVFADSKFLVGEAGSPQPIGCV